MTLDNMTGITKGSYTGGDLFCKSQLITCNRVKECNGVCPFEDALKHADEKMNEQTVIDHDREWVIGCIKHDGFIKTDRFDKANQIILDALSADTESDDLIIKNGKGIQDGLYNIKDGEIFKYKAKGGTVRAYKLVPSVSAERVGEWKQDGDGYRCSACEMWYNAKYYHEPYEWSYCPNCSAKMKGGTE